MNSNGKQQQTIDVLSSILSNPNHTIKEYVRDINISNFTLDPIGGGPPLIRAAEITLSHGHRYGLIGYNGTGKTTFLSKLADGSLKQIPKYLRVLHVHQELHGSSMTVKETVLAADVERDALLREEKRLNLEMVESMIADHTQTLLEIHDRLRFIESETAEARASDVLNGLCFTDRMKNMKTSDLSGGWRMRVSLACALFVEPEILLLDEPTNHLDFPSVIWLSEYLSLCYPKEKTIVIVSHDRRFLNDVCTDIIHLDRCHMQYYKGNYDSFIQIRSQMRTHQKKQYFRQQKMIAHNLKFIAKFKANKKWSTQAQSRQKLLNRVHRIEKVLGDLEFRFDFPVPPPLKNPLMVNMEDVSFGYFGDSNADTFLLKNIQLRLSFGTKVGILGANGSGKSTLLKLIMEELQPLIGTSYLANAVEVGYFSQHHLDILDYDATPLEHLKNVFGNATQQEIYSQLGRFKLGDKYARRKIGTLSGGQKSRVAFCILTWYSPHLIIMDEPTNHLDMPTIDALSMALSGFEGSVLVVSHDQYFLENVCDEYWCVGGRSVRLFEDFEKCRQYSQKAKAPNVLPREFSSVVQKENTFYGRHSSGSKKKIKEDENKEEHKMASVSLAVESADIWGIDPEREIDRGLEKNLTPDQILRHVKQWNAVDGSTMIVAKIGFIMFHDFFDTQYENMADEEFFERWKKLFCHCIPLKHTQNQTEFVNVLSKAYITAIKDKKTKAVQSTYSLGIILEVLVELEMLNIQCVQNWLNKNSSNTNTFLSNVCEQVQCFLTAAEEDDENSD